MLTHFESIPHIFMIPLVFCLMIALVLCAYFLVAGPRLLYYKLQIARMKNSAAEHLKDMIAEKNTAISDLQLVINQLKPSDDIKSPLPILEFVADISGTERRNYRVSALSSAGKQFFGYNQDTPTSRLKDTPLEKLRERLPGYITPPSSFWADLSKDQTRVMQDFYSNQTPTARYPIIFNGSHNEPAFRNKCFVPVIVEARQTKNGSGTEQEFVKVIYLDTDILPQYVLRREIWESLKADKKINFLALPGELRKLQSHLQSKYNEQDSLEPLQAVSDALTDLEQRNGSFEFIECCAKIGFFALRDYATELHLDQVRRLVERLLGPDAEIQNGQRSRAQNDAALKRQVSMQAV